MSTILKKGDFHFSCKTSTGKTIMCQMKNGEVVKANFDQLEISYDGTVRVMVERGPKAKKEYISVQCLLPQNKADNEYFDFAINEIKIISNKRKTELKAQQIAKTKERGFRIKRSKKTQAQEQSA
jgi:hypothetical protein